MKYFLRMEADGWNRHGNIVHGAGSEITIYTVLGMPAGHVRIIKSGERWAIDDVSEAARLHPSDYGSPEEALAALQAELDEIITDDANSW